MMLPSYRKLFLISAISIAPALWGTAEAAADPQGPIAPRPKSVERPEAPSPKANIRVDSTLVLIPVTVTDPMNRFVTGLDRENFKIFEDKKEQEVRQFSSEDAPLSIGVIFDCSGSMGRKLDKSRQAVAQFFKTSNPDDEFFLVQFNDSADLIQPFTKNLEDIQNRLTFTQSKGRTALLDAVYLGLHEMKKSKNPRKALLIISDGGDNSSRYTEGEIKNLVKEADVQIYGIGIYEPIAARGRTPEEAQGQGLLTEIAEQTGGRQYPVDNLNELPDIAAKIGVELRNQYVLGYSPQNQERDGKYRKVQVKLVQPRGLPQLRAFHKMGYYAPSQ
jgi:VWFA-related protein